MSQLTPANASGAYGSVPAPADEWESLSEDLLRGLVHAMNNRVTALSAFTELASMDGAALELDLLREEVVRLRAVSALIGALATHIDEIEALEIRPVLDVALQIHAHHPRTRSLPCAVEVSGLVLPVRVPRWALLRVFLLMIDAAKRASDAARDTAVIVRLSGGESSVRAHVDSTEAPATDAANLATRCGGRIVQAREEQILELPTLLEVRRRERGAS